MVSASVLLADEQAESHSEPATVGPASVPRRVIPNLIA